MIFLDTGYLVALVDPDDALQSRAQKWSVAIHEPLIVTRYVLVELLNHFSRPQTRERGHEIMRQLEANSMCEVVHEDEPLFRAGLDLHASRRDKEWSLTDCVSFVVMRRRGVTRALAYDHHFEQAGFEALLRREP